MQFFEFHRGLGQRLLAFLLLTGTIVPFGAQAAGPESAPASDARADQQNVLKVEGIAIRAADESPRVLHILPWQPPTIRRSEREPLSSAAGNLLEPVNPEAFYHHRVFRRTLDPGRLSEQ